MWTKVQLGHVEYLGWWTEQLDELKAVRCFVTDSLISVITPGNKCSWLSFLRLNSSYLVFITLYFIKKRSRFFFLQNWNPDLQHECRSTGPPVLGEAGSCELFPQKERGSWIAAKEHVSCDCFCSDFHTSSVWDTSEHVFIKQDRIPLLSFPLPSALLSQQF